MSSSANQFNAGPWTNDEHQRFLRGVEVHGRGNWDAIGALVRTRNPQQIEAHAGQHFAQSTEEERLLEPAEPQTTGTVATVTVAGGTATTPGPTLTSGNGFFGNGNILYDWTGVL